MELHDLPVLPRRNTSRNRIDALRRSGRIRPLLPGVHVAREAPETFGLRVEAAAAWRPGVRFCGSTAARLTWWEDLPDDTVRINARIRHSPATWITGDQRLLSPDLFLPLGQAAWVATPAFSVLDMAAAGDGNAICEALRRGACTLSDMFETLTLLPRAKGNALRKKLLEESRDEPWSPLEREAHMLLRAAGITGWVTNHEIRIDQQSYFADIAFPRQRLAVEIDGWKYHSSRASFEWDRIRQNELVCAGWLVLRFTDQTLAYLQRQVRMLVSG